jgi:broad specificity phosphatase PhoE
MVEKGHMNTSATSHFIEFMLIRHAEKIPGRLDAGLTKLGMDQAARVAKTLVQWRPDALFSSPLPRSQQTAEAISVRTGLRPILRGCLVERRINPAPGDGTPGFKEEWARVDSSRDYSAHGGESSRLAGQRLFECLVDIAEHHHAKRIVVVTHAGVTRDFLLNITEGQEQTLISASLLPSELAHATLTGVRYQNSRFSPMFLACASDCLPWGVMNSG